MRKISKNLSLDPEAVRRGEIYSALHRTSVSALVSEFLSRLPVEQGELDAEALSPTVRRLLGAAAGDAAHYHEYLAEKYDQ